MYTCLRMPDSTKWLLFGCSCCNRMQVEIGKRIYLFIAAIWAVVHGVYLGGRPADIVHTRLGGATMRGAPSYQRKMHEPVFLYASSLHGWPLLQSFSTSHVCIYSDTIPYHTASTFAPFSPLRSPRNLSRTQEGTANLPMGRSPATCITLMT